MDVFEQVVGEIHAKLADKGHKVPHGFGNLSLAKHDAPPRIVWIETGGQFVNSQKTGGPEGNQYTAQARVQIWIWHETYEKTRTLMHALLEAIRATVFGPNLHFDAAGWEVPTQVEGRWLQGAWQLFVLNANLRFPVLIESGVQTVTIQAHQGTIEAEEYDVTIQGPPA